MGSRLYEFLRYSFLLEEQHLENGFRAFSDDQIRKELQRYAEFCKNEAPGLRADAIARESHLRMLSGTTRFPIENLKQGALYVEQYVISDPLYVIAAPGGLWDGSPQMVPPDATEHPLHPRKQLVDATRYLAAISPMAGADYVKPLPMADLIGAGVPYATTLVSTREQLIPRDLFAWFAARALIHGRNLFGRPDEPPSIVPYEKAPEGFFYHRGTSFVNDGPNEWTPPHFRWEKPALERIIDPDTETPQLEFAVATAAFDLMHRLAREITLAGELAAEYHGRSRFALELLQMLGHRPSGGPERRTADAVQELSLPSLQGLDIETLMRVRTQEGDAFQALRDELEERLGVLVAEPNEEQRRMKLQLIGEGIERQLRGAEREIQRLSAKFKLESVAAVGGLATAILSADPLSKLIGVVTATAGGAAMFKEYRSAQRKHPLFFLSRALTEAKKNKG